MVTLQCPLLRGPLAHVPLHWHIVSCRLTQVALVAPPAHSLLAHGSLDSAPPVLWHTAAFGRDPLSTIVSPSAAFSSALFLCTKLFSVALSPNLPAHGFPGSALFSTVFPPRLHLCPLHSLLRHDSLVVSPPQPRTRWLLSSHTGCFRHVLFFTVPSHMVPLAVPPPQFSCIRPLLAMIPFQQWFHSGLLSAAPSSIAQSCFR